MFTTEEKPSRFVPFSSVLILSSFSYVQQRFTACRYAWECVSFVLNTFWVLASFHKRFIEMYILHSLPRLRLLYTAYCIMYTVYFKLYNVYCIMYSIYCIMYTVYRILKMYILQINLRIFYPLFSVLLSRCFIKFQFPRLHMSDRTTNALQRSYHKHLTAIVPQIPYSNSTTNTLRNFCVVSLFKCVQEFSI